MFVLGYLGHVRAIVGNSYRDLADGHTRVELSKLADVALDIGRSAGCSAYENDFTLPDIPTQWRNQPLAGTRVKAPAPLPAVGLSD